MWRNIRLGAFMIGALMILAVGVFLIGKRQFLFSSTYRLNTSFDSVAGLKGGAEVRVGGIEKGMVKQIQLPTTPEGKVTVVMEMENSTREIIKQDSISSIQTEGILGEKYMEISFGSVQSPDVREGDTIASQPPLDITGLIKKADQILDSTQETVGNANEVMNNVRSITGKVDRGKGTVGALINDRKVYEEARNAAAQAKIGVTSFQENMEALKHNWFLRGYFKRRGYTNSAELTEHEIPQLPRESPVRNFAYDAKQLFDKLDTAKLQNEKTLNEAGKFLQANKFGLAVVVASTGMKGDSSDNLALSQARAMVIRDYLVKNFQMDDTLVKTKGLGKSAQANEGGAGRVEVIIYPVGSEIPSERLPAVSKR